MEIYEYLEECVDRFGLQPHLRLGVSLREAAFESTPGLWRMHIDPGPDLEARIIVLATGMLHRPAIPALPGSNSFGAPRSIRRVGTMTRRHEVNMWR